MNNFDEFKKYITGNPSKNTTLIINGKKKNIKGMVGLTTKNYPESEYIKIVFNDRSFLLIMINDKEIYYADKIIDRIHEISDNVIGKVDAIKYNGKEYKLGNRDDYQYVIQRYVGTPNDVEGEARFSDYFPISGPKEYLSLGWLSETGERADINCKIIDVKEIVLPE